MRPDSRAGAHTDWRRAGKPEQDLMRPQIPAAIFGYHDGWRIRITGNQEGIPMRRPRKSHKPADLNLSISHGHSSVPILHVQQGDKWFRLCDGRNRSSPHRIVDRRQENLSPAIGKLPGQKYSRQPHTFDHHPTIVSVLR
jgi:hypothetical protein